MKNLYIALSILIPLGQRIDTLSKEVLGE